MSISKGRSSIFFFSGKRKW